MPREEMPCIFDSQVIYRELLASRFIPPTLSRAIFSRNRLIDEFHAS